MSDPTQGDAPLKPTGPTVTINDREYTLRRLGWLDTLAVARIIAIGAASTNQKSIPNDEFLKPERMMEMLLAGVMHAGNEAIKLLASVIGVHADDVKNPDLFPMGSELDVIAALAEHDDLRAFFAKAAALAKRLPQTPTASPAPSTSSAGTSSPAGRMNAS